MRGEKAGENDLIVAVKLEDSADTSYISRLVEELLTQPGAGDLEIHEDLDTVLNIYRAI